MYIRRPLGISSVFLGSACLSLGSTVPNIVAIRIAEVTELNTLGRIPIQRDSLESFRGFDRATKCRGSGELLQFFHDGAHRSRLRNFFLNNIVSSVSSPTAAAAAAACHGVLVFIVIIQLVRVEYKSSDRSPRCTVSRQSSLGLRPTTATTTPHCSFFVSTGNSDCSQETACWDTLVSPPLLQRRGGGEITIGSSFSPMRIFTAECGASPMSRLSMRVSIFVRHDNFVFPGCWAS